MVDSPRMLVVGGPNGSGKTTLALEYAAETGFPYLRADAIAASIDPDEPERAQFAAGGTFIAGVNDHIAGRRSFVAESTLSGLTMRKSITAARSNGYVVSIAFLFVDSAEVCVARVAERVRKGGHSVPESDVRRRFSRAVNNFWIVYREMADNWVLLYNGDTAMKDVAAGSRDQFAIRDPATHALCLTLVEGSDNG